jgi:hypothetical protein
MTQKLPRLASRALALLILAGAACILYAGIVWPLLDDLDTARRQLAQSSAFAERYRRIADELPRRREALAAIRQRPTTETGFLDGANEALAAAALQSRIRALVASAHGELKSTQILPVQPDGTFRRVGVRSEMTIALAGAQQVLYAIEASPPWLMLDNVVLDGREAERQRERNPESAALALSFDAFGYLPGTP